MTYRLINCEQPSNQLRILKEQLAEVGRWIGAVFYSTIAKVLPYINGFVMAVKEVIKAFALLIGYKIPDSSKETGTILDHMTDNMEDYNYAIDGVNGGLDKTKDKLKEIEGSLASFDKLNIIQGPKDEPSTGGGGGGGAGLSGMTLDPAILKALEQYQYVFDDVDMKAHRIRDCLLEWLDIAKKTINENIFAPLGASWDKYGESISKNLDGVFLNIKKIVDDILQIIAKDWKQNFELTADVFFTTFDSASLLLESLTSIFRGVWFSGGKQLFEGVLQLVQAFKRLWVSINNYFIKPFIRSFRDDLGPIIISFFGVLADGITAVVKLFTTLLNAIAKNKTATVMLSSAVTGLLVAMKTAKVVAFFQSLNKGKGILIGLYEHLYENSKRFKKLADVIHGVTDTYTKLTGALKNTQIYQSVQGALGKLTEKMVAQNGAIALLGKAMGWLVANPLVALGGALAVGIGTMVAFGSSSEETKVKMEDLGEEMQAQAQRCNELKQAIEQTADKQPQIAEDYEVQIALVGEYLGALKGLADENGYVTNQEKAKALIEKINQILPDTVKLTEDNRLEWQKTPEEIEKTTKALKEQAKQQAYIELYTEQLKNKIQLEQEMANMRGQITAKQIQQEELLAKIRSGNYSADEVANMTWQSRALGDEITALNGKLGEMGETYDLAEESLRNYSDCLTGTKDVLGDTTEQVQKLCDTLGLNDEQKTSIMTSVDEVSRAYENMGNSTSETASANKQHLDEMMKKFSDLAVAYGVSSDDMISILKSKGVQLTKEQIENFKKVTEKQRMNLHLQEKQYDDNQKSILNKLVGFNLNEKNLTSKQAIEMYNILEKYGVNTSTLKQEQLDSYLKMLEDYNIDYKSAEGQQYAELLKLLQEHGIDMASEQGQQYAKGLQEAQIKGVENGKAYLTSITSGYLSADQGEPLTKAISGSISKAQNFMYNNPLVATVTPESGLNTKISNKIGTINLKGKLTIGNVVSNLSRSVKDAFGKLGINMFAGGGFPRVGQMFIANEKGPELVGRMGSRTVVANNQQIVDGVSNGVSQGVYDGMIRAMRNSGTFKPNITLVNNQVVDGKIVRKEVKKMQDENILLTGDPLFD